MDIAILKADGWPSALAEQLLEEYEGDPDVLLATFMELCSVEGRFAFDRDRAVTAILDPATYSRKPDVLYQTSEYTDEGLTTFNACHATHSCGRIGSSNGATDERGV